MENATPMLRQYLDIKKRYPGTILFFRLGDFYEMFNEDALIGSRELEITLTARQKDSPNPIPMCGVPHHAASNYIAKLVRKGFRVAICEQAEPSGQGVKLVKREVVRVITPGTAIDSHLLNSREPMILAALCGGPKIYGAAFLDLSTGDFSATQTDGPQAWQKIIEQIDSFAPREIIFPKDISGDIKHVFLANEELPFQVFSTDDGRSSSSESSVTLTELAEDEFGLADELSFLTSHFGTKGMEGFGFEGKLTALRAAGACLRYAQLTQRSSADHISAITYLDSNEFMVIDGLTQRNLELFESRGADNKRTLLKVLDETITGMGSRLLRSWMLRPLVRRNEIGTRLSAVEELLEPIKRDRLRSLLKQIADLERLIGRLNLGNSSPRDLLALKRSLEQVPEITFTLSAANSHLLQVLAENLFELPKLVSLINSGIADEPSNNVSEGGVIREGFDRDLDEARELSRSGKQMIAAIEDREREKTGIPTLKVRFNSVFGYYIEVSKAQLSKVPAEYERRQTLANAERYSTLELKTWEQKVIGSEERSKGLESEIFEMIRDSAKAETQSLQSTARALAVLDALLSFAETAMRRNYVKPLFHDGDEIEIKNARHPVVEAFMGDSFVPNDLYLNNSTDRLLIVTGANMGGKSTILRQVGIIQILAQIGCYIPATSGRMPIVDRIWTRVGASDDLASGRSTFMVEMTETSAILHNCTPRSLILMDEIGRGTSTFDGMSIAWAVAEYLHNSPEHSAKTLFATHYHELTELAEHLAGARNYQMAAVEKDDDVVFLHKLVKGKSSKSYGIAVARLAGMPQEVIERARKVLSRLEAYELAVFSGEGDRTSAMAVGKVAAAQLTLFDAANEALIEEIRGLNFDSLSAEDGLRILREIRSKIN